MTVLPAAAAFSNFARDDDGQDEGDHAADREGVRRELKAKHLGRDDPHLQHQEQHDDRGDPASPAR
jgi:hypothetical protein